MKKYDIPEDLLILRDRSMAAKALCDLYVKTPICYDLALIAAEEEVTSIRLFWSGIRALHPELAWHTIALDNRDHKAYIDNEAGKPEGYVC